MRRPSCRAHGLCPPRRPATRDVPTGARMAVLAGSEVRLRGQRLPQLDRRHWRLVSLVELGVPAGEPRALAAAEQVLGWWVRPERLRAVPVIDGLARRCASQEGNALAVCCRLGLAEDERVRLLADSLLSWQWPDGGWNCDLMASGRRSSFHESLAPAWGLHGTPSPPAMLPPALRRGGRRSCSSPIACSARSRPASLWGRTGSCSTTRLLALRHPPGPAYPVRLGGAADPRL